MQAERSMPRLGSPAPAVLIAALLAATSGCSSPVSPGGPPPEPPPNGFFLVGAGDIALCGSPGPEATARLLDGIQGIVFTAGDNAYPRGSVVDFEQCYEPTWGRHRDRTFPVPGNHEYEIPGAGDYFDYFGSAAGARGSGYYVYYVGPWRVIALNSEIGVRTGSPQAEWLRHELTTTKTPCTMAIWHRPLFSSGPNRDNPDLRDVFRLLYDFSAEVVVNGHDHLYERFAPQDADGRLDRTRGIRQFTVGTGGAPLYDPGPRQSTSEALHKVWGVLKFTLSDGAFTWEFIAVGGGGARDTGSGVCH